MVNPSTPFFTGAIHGIVELMYMTYGVHGIGASCPLLTFGYGAFAHTACDKSRIDTYLVCAPTVYRFVAGALHGRISSSVVGPEHAKGLLQEGYPSSRCVEFFMFFMKPKENNQRRIIDFVAAETKVAHFKEQFHFAMFLRFPQACLLAELYLSCSCGLGDSINSHAFTHKQQ